MIMCRGEPRILRGPTVPRPKRGDPEKAGLTSASSGASLCRGEDSNLHVQLDTGS